MLSPLQGYKVLVSNLHPIVTQDDIIVSTQCQIFIPHADNHMVPMLWEIVREVFSWSGNLKEYQGRERERWDSVGELSGNFE